ncbi:hypothetical protein BaRGS_00027670 [Batillaria attramentaria]|uniref:Uncharacterized protein n=1 Tax=Batillaria attramentaria TaxID=370345 RepID=A0ABD0K153_9CAEN
MARARLKPDILRSPNPTPHILSTRWGGEESPAQGTFDQNLPKVTSTRIYPRCLPDHNVHRVPLGLPEYTKGTSHPNKPKVPSTRIHARYLPPEYTPKAPSTKIYTSYLPPEYTPGTFHQNVRDVPFHHNVPKVPSTKLYQSGRQCQYLRLTVLNTIPRHLSAFQPKEQPLGAPRMANAQVRLTVTDCQMFWCTAGRVSKCTCHQEPKVTNAT